LQPPIERGVEVRHVIAKEGQPPGAFVGLNPHARPVGKDLAVAVHPYPPAGAIAQVLGTTHRTGEPGGMEDALAAHPAVPHGFFERLLYRDDGPLE
jgi:hypothetical protein